MSLIVVLLVISNINVIDFVFEYYMFTFTCSVCNSCEKTFQTCRKQKQYQFHSGDSPIEGISMLLWMSCEWVMSIWSDWLVKIYSLELVRYENAAHNFIRRVTVGILDWITMSAMMTVYVWSMWNLLIMGET